VTALKAGILLGFAGLFINGLLTECAGLILQEAAYNQHLFPAAGKSVGMGITAGIGIVLLGLGLRFVFRPGFEVWARRLEEQGWFDLATYKRSQGQRVRRGTMLGVLVLAGCGVYTLLAHRTLETGPRDWTAPIPFTGTVTITDPGDAAVLGDAQLAPGATVDPFVLRDLNDRLVAEHVRITDPGDSDLQKLQVVRRDTYEKAVEQYKEEKPPVAEPPQPASGSTQFQSLTILPDIRFTLPILLAAFSLWFAYRLVNYPPFADFLIATEAELNKVSWTTRKRLIQDTTVVLVTVLLLTVFLFVVDLVWVKVFNFIQVLQTGPTAAQKKENQLDW